MEASTNVLEYKCPCCDAGLIFDQASQRMVCPYCDNSFEPETVRAYMEQRSRQNSSTVSWDKQNTQTMSQEENAALQCFVCQSCGGELLTDHQTAATFCPYCGNPAVLPARLDGALKPDGIIPFKLGKAQAMAAFQNLCKGKPLLPSLFRTKHQIEKITGIYVPFWLFDCQGTLNGSYKATRVHSWSDRDYVYTKTDHYMLNRRGNAAFAGIPMDGSSKIEDSFMESIEPYDYSQIQPFQSTYLSGFLADKFDVDAKACENRIRQRVDHSMDELLQPSFMGYATVVPTSKQLDVSHSKANYILLPVWFLNTRYKDKVYTFAMNGQTGKMTGSFPICPKRTAAWFAGIAAGVTLIASVLMAIFG